MSQIDNLVQKIARFNAEREWAQFHNPKDLAIALSVEAAELVELFLWKSPEEVSPQSVQEELADVFAFALMLAEKYGFDVEQIVSDKINANARKYPVEKAKGSSKKYNEL